MSNSIEIMVLMKLIGSTPNDDDHRTLNVFVAIGPSFSINPIKSKCHFLCSLFTHLMSKHLK